MIVQYLFSSPEGDIFIGDYFQGIKEFLKNKLEGHTKQLHRAIQRLRE